MPKLKSNPNDKKTVEAKLKGDPNTCQNMLYSLAQAKNPEAELQKMLKTAPFNTMDITASDLVGALRDASAHHVNNNTPNFMLPPGINQKIQPVTSAASKLDTKREQQMDQHIKACKDNIEKVKQELQIPGQPQGKKDFLNASLASMQKELQQLQDPNSHAGANPAQPIPKGKVGKLQFTGDDMDRSFFDSKNIKELFSRPQMRESHLVQAELDRLQTLAQKPGVTKTQKEQLDKSIAHINALVENRKEAENLYDRVDQLRAQVAANDGKIDDDTRRELLELNKQISQLDKDFQKRASIRPKDGPLKGMAFTPGQAENAIQKAIEENPELKKAIKVGGMFTGFKVTTDKNGNPKVETRSLNALANFLFSDADNFLVNMMQRREKSEQLTQQLQSAMKPHLPQTPKPKKNPKKNGLNLAPAAAQPAGAGPAPAPAAVGPKGK